MMVTLKGTRMSKPIILSGIQPTNGLHLGNYLGALRNWTKMEEEHECYFSIVNQHAITTNKISPAELRQNSLYAAAAYIAAGIDPEKSAIFIQSDVAEHSQLTWILNCRAYMGELNRMTQFKDKSATAGKNIPAGLYTYPLLMAADILLYDANLVPVGEDQKQHIELTRNLAERMNNQLGEDTFVVPEPYIAKVAARVMDLLEPTNKMSKSAVNPAGCVFFSDSAKQIEKKFKRAMTDSDSIIAYDVKEKPGVSNLLGIQSAITGKSIEDIVASYEGKMYGHLKVDTAEIVNAELSPIKEKIDELMSDETELRKILDKGADKARAKASVTLKRVYDRIGF